MSKIRLITAVSFLAGTLALGQGTVNFNTRVVPEVAAQVFMPDGTPLSGADWTAQLYGGPNADSLTPLTPTTIFRTGAGAGFVVPVGDVAVTGVPGGGTATLQLRVWQNLGGTLTSYDAAVSAGAWYGQSAIFTVSGLGDIDAIPPTVSPNLIGLESFGMIPEPATYALLALGAAAFLFYRRSSS